MERIAFMDFTKEVDIRSSFLEMLADLLVDFKHYRLEIERCVLIDRSTLIACLNDVQAVNHNAMKLIRIHEKEEKFFAVQVCFPYQYRKDALFADEFVAKYSQIVESRDMEINQNGISGPCVD